MKSIRSNPTAGAPEGDERIRTAEQAPGTDSVYVLHAGSWRMSPLGLLLWFLVYRWRKGAAS